MTIDNSFLLLQNDVHVWKAFIVNHYARYHELFGLLDDFEVNRLNRYRFERDKERFVIRRGLLRILLAEYLKKDAADVVISYDKKGKPVIDDMHFNLSFSDSYILFAVAGSPVGVDIEKVDIGFDYHDIVEHNFCMSEKIVINQSKRPVNTFYEIWTRKEALVKATAEGITEDFKDSGSVDWLIDSFEVSDGYVGSVARGRDTLLRFFDLDTFCKFSLRENARNVSHDGVCMPFEGRNFHFVKTRTLS